ncbi:MAG TPA: RNA ligase family protein [Oculatellaceae cyanobacterium]|jgi:hypothetical protein
MTFDIYSVDLKKLNSLTKYPSIPTYHALGERGKLSEAVQVNFANQFIIGTEKIDGTNARIICFPEGYILGSREELLYAKGDLIGNPAMGIVEALKPLAERIYNKTVSNSITVYYLEFYGGKITTASKNYTSKGTTGYKLFDCALIQNPEALLTRRLEDISLEREKGGKYFLPEESLSITAKDINVELTPRLFEADGAEFPQDIQATYKLLSDYSKSLSVLDSNSKGKSEGVVLRTKDRKAIAKLRFQDYERTLNLKTKNQS